MGASTVYVNIRGTPRFYTVAPNHAWRKGVITALAVEAPRPDARGIPDHSDGQIAPPKSTQHRQTACPSDHDRVEKPESHYAGGEAGDIADVCAVASADFDCFDVHLCAPDVGSQSAECTEFRFQPGQPGRGEPSHTIGDLGDQMPRRRKDAHLFELAKLGAQARLGELLQEAKNIIGLFPHLRDSFDKDALPVSFILKRGARRAREGAGPRGRRRMSAAARKVVSERMKRYWAQRRKAAAKK